MTIHPSDVTMDENMIHYEHFNTSFEIISFSVFCISFLASIHSLIIHIKINNRNPNFMAYFISCHFPTLDDGISPTNHLGNESKLSRHTAFSSMDSFLTDPDTFIKTTAASYDSTLSIKNRTHPTC